MTHYEKLKAFDTEQYSEALVKALSGSKITDIIVTMSMYPESVFVRKFTYDGQSYCCGIAISFHVINHAPSLIEEYILGVVENVRKKKTA